MLSLRDLRKSYGTLRAVDGVSLEVRRGEVFGLLGPNGAGKSTTIAIASGLLRPDGGEARIEGAGSPDDPAARRRLGVCPQALAVYEELTAPENLAFFGRLYGLRGADLRSRVGAMLELAGLTDRRRSRVSTYSGGMKRRLNLACALVHGPVLLFLDEPTVGVDPQSRNAIFDAIERLRGEGLTVIYTTHYMEEAQRLCDRVGVIDHGRLLAVGTVDALLAAHGGESVVTVERDGADPQRIATRDPVQEVSRALAVGGVRGVRIDRPNLETVFLALTGRTLRD